MSRGISGSGTWKWWSSGAVTGRLGLEEGVLYMITGRSGMRGVGSAEVGAGTIDVGLGALGSIDARFVPAGGSRLYRPWCGGSPVSFRRGFWTGTIRLSAGQGYPLVEATIGQSTPGAQLKNQCAGKAVAVGPSFLRGAQLIADSVDLRVPEFEVFKESPDSAAYIDAAVHEYRSGVSIIRFASIESAASSFRYSRSLGVATVRPPRPFSGNATYRARRRPATRWSGNLKVDLPGRDHVSLTRTPIRAFINPARWMPAHAKTAQ